MGRKAKVSYEDKVKACEDYINGKASAREIATRLGLGKSGDCRIYGWARKYRNLGPESLQTKPRNNSYTALFKKTVVEEYLSGGGSLDDLSIKYQIPSSRTLSKWVIKYNNLEELKDYAPEPEVYRKMARKKTTKEERIQIVNYCIEHDKDYKGTASFYDVSYSQVYSWVKKFSQLGEDGLSDNRGKRKEESQLTDSEKKDREIQRLQRRVKELEMEAALLKKVQEIEGRRYFQNRKTKRNT